MKILVVVAHPDDETLGIGATIAAMTRGGHTVQGAYLTDGVGARGWNPKAAQKRRERARKAADILGMEWIYEGEFPDQRLDTVPLLAITQELEALKAKPDQVWTHLPCLRNNDHDACCRAVLPAFRGIEVYGFHVPGDVQFPPVSWQDAKGYMLTEDDRDRKERAWKAYGEPLRAAQTDEYRPLWRLA